MNRCHLSVRQSPEGVPDRLSGFSYRMWMYDPAQASDIYRVRRIIKLDSIGHIGAKGSSLGRIAVALQGFAALRAADDWSRIVKTDVAFHRTVVDTAGSPWLRVHLAGIASEILLLIGLLQEQYIGGEPLCREHEG